MDIIPYENAYRQAVIDLILHIQNDEAKIHLSLEEQPDLLDIPNAYEATGGKFWIAVDRGDVVGTLAFMNYGNGNAVLKKFFVRADWRKKKLGLALYQKVLLDTPSVATASHRFYERAGFRRIEKSDCPFPYHYPDRDSYLYLLILSK